MMERIVVKSLKELPQAAREFIKATKDYSIIALYGKMGAGKTTFIRALCAEMGIEDDVNSPTFNIVNEYRDDRGQTVYHFDFYRIESPAEALDIGFYEYALSGDLCLIEWPQKIEQILPQETLKVQISVLEDESRVITISRDREDMELSGL